LYFLFLNLLSSNSTRLSFLTWFLIIAFYVLQNCIPAKLKLLASSSVIWVVLLICGLWWYCHK
jgi:hypothetical protein